MKPFLTQMRFPYGVPHQDNPASVSRTFECCLVEGIVGAGTASPAWRDRGAWGGNAAPYTSFPLHASLAYWQDTYSHMRLRCIIVNDLDRFLIREIDCTVESVGARLLVNRLCVFAVAPRLVALSSRLVLGSGLSVPPFCAYPRDRPASSCQPVPVPLTAATVGS
jgi:hypothetical protein